MKSKIRKSKKKRIQKQRQKQHINLHISMTGGGSGGGGIIPWYIPGKPTVGEAHLPNQAALVPNVGEPRVALREDLASPIDVPPRSSARRSRSRSEARAPASVERAASDVMPPAEMPPTVGEPTEVVGAPRSSGTPYVPKGPPAEEGGGASAGIPASLFGSPRPGTSRPSGRKPTYYPEGSVAERTRRALTTSG